MGSGKEGRGRGIQEEKQHVSQPQGRRELDAFSDREPGRSVEDEVDGNQPWHL